MTPAPEPISWNEYPFWWIATGWRSFPETAFHLSFVRTIKGDRLETVARSVVAVLTARHKILLATFRWSGFGEPHRHYSLSTDRFLLGIKGSREFGSEETPLGSLEEGPLFACKLSYVDRRVAEFEVHVHHAIADAWSLSLLTEEVRALVVQIQAGVKPDPTPRVPQYQEFVHYQQTRLQSAAQHRSVDYWIRLLDGAPRVFDLERRIGPMSGAGLGVNFVLGSVLDAEIHALGRRLRVTPSMVLLTAFATVIALATGTETSLVIETVVHGRPPGWNRTIGSFSANQLSRLSIPRAATLAECATQVRNQALQNLQHFVPPFALSAALQKRGYPPLPRSEFAFNFRVDPAASLDGARAIPERPRILDPTIASANGLWLTYRSTATSGTFRHDLDRMNPLEGKALVGCFIETLQAFVGSSGATPVSRLEPPPTVPLRTSAPWVRDPAPTERNPDEFEAMLLRTVREVCQLPHLGLTQRLLTEGGTFTDGVRLVRALTALGHDLSVHEIIEAGTVERLAGLLNSTAVQRPSP